MEIPKIIGANMLACATQGDGGWAVVGAAMQSGGMIAVALVCNAPAAGAALAGGLVG